MPLASNQAVFVLSTSVSSSAAPPAAESAYVEGLRNPEEVEMRRSSTLGETPPTPYDWQLAARKERSNCQPRPPSAKHLRQRHANVEFVE